MTAVRNPTQWIPGYITYIGLLDFQDNKGNLLIDNLGNNISTNLIQVAGKYATAWTLTGS
jgi:hypothetical protein